MKRRVKFASRVFESRLARTAFVVTVWPPLYLAERVRGAMRGWREAETASWRVGLAWARTGDAEHQPTIPTTDLPAVVSRRRRPTAGTR